MCDLIPELSKHLDFSCHTSNMLQDKSGIHFFLNCSNFFSLLIQGLVHWDRMWVWGMFGNGFVLSIFRTCTVVGTFCG
jgi:hypothetical protein